MRLVFAAKDPGGCDSLIPIINELSDNEILCMMSESSKAILKKNSIEFLDVDSMSDGEIYDNLRKFNPNVCIFGTSFGYSIDKKIIEYASKNDIATLSIVDYWSNYWGRFIQSNKQYLPDSICVIDELMKQEMLDLGFEKSILKVTGNPRFVMYKNDPRKHDENIILFISQPLRADDLQLGYDEYQVLEDVIEALNIINIKKHKIVIKLHPREKKNKYESIVKKSSIPLVLNRDSDIEELIQKSVLLIGMSSIVLFHAALLGKSVISYQPNVKKDLFILNKMGIQKTIKSKTELVNDIKRIINGKRKLLNNNLANKYCNETSISKVVSLVRSLAK